MGQPIGTAKAKMERDAMKMDIEVLLSLVESILKRVSELEKREKDRKLEIID